jgi:hypothetical protein
MTGQLRFVAPATRNHFDFFNFFLASQRPKKNPNSASGTINQGERGRSMSIRLGNSMAFLSLAHHHKPHRTLQADLAN